MSGLLDTGFLLAVLDADDEFHTVKYSTYSDS
jgi:hypothetical protein